MAGNLDPDIKSWDAAKAKAKYRRNLQQQRYADRAPLDDDEQTQAKAAMLLDAMTFGNGDEILGGVGSIMGRRSYRDGVEQAKSLRRRHAMTPSGDTDRGIAAGLGGALSFATPARLAVPLMGAKAVTSDTGGGALTSGQSALLGTLFNSSLGKQIFPPSVRALAKVTGQLGSVVDENNDEHRELEAWKKAHTKGRPSTKQSDRAQIRAAILKAMGE